LYLHSKCQAAASDISAEKPEPVLSPLHAGTLPRSWLGREKEGHYQNTKHSPLPASPGSIASSLESSRNPSVVIL